MLHPAIGLNIFKTMKYKKLDTWEVAQVLKALNIKVKSTNGWQRMSSPFREDKNPSFSIDPINGSWKDFGTGETGSIIDLIKKSENFTTNKEVKEWLDHVLNRIGNYSKPAKKSNFKIIDQSDQLKDTIPEITLKEIANRSISYDSSKFQDINDHTDSEILKEILDYDGLTQETLERYNCKLTEEYGNTELIFPYPTGAQRYRRVNNEKHILQLKGSKPTESFFGIDNLEPKNTLIIAKSPREAMLVAQELGEQYAVIGLSSAEISKLTMDQKSIIKELKDVHDRIITILDCDTEEAHMIAKDFAKNIKTITGDDCEVLYLNIHKISSGTYKDLADIYRDEGVLKFDLSQACEVEPQPVFNEKDKYWNSKGKINPSKLLTFLEKEGLFKRYSGKNCIAYRDDGTFIYEISEHQIKDFIRQHLDSISPDHLPEDIKNEVVSRLITMNANNLLQTTNEKELDNLSKDDKNFSLVFYKDVFIKVTKDAIEHLEYSELEGSIWHSEMIKRSAPKEVLNEPGEFEEFIELITGNNAKRKQSAMECIGYMLHRYKNKAFVKAVILTDEKVGQNNSSNGGTGKTIFAKALQHIRPIHVIAGKQFDSGHRFAFMDYQEKYQIILIDDIKKNFDFAGLFTVISGELPVERKHENRILIPFARSPKIIITSNDPITGDGESYKRRQFILEFAPKFDSKRTPLEHFGHLLFDDWDDQEWKKFDSFMIRCIQQFLDNGLNEVLVNYEQRKIITDTCQSFYEWAETYLELDVEYDQRQLFRGVSEINVTYDAGVIKPKNSKNEYFPSYRLVDSKQLSETQIRTFKTFLERFCEYKGWEMKSRHTDGDTIIWFVKQDEEDE